jgi:hypothetical protein
VADGHAGPATKTYQPWLAISKVAQTRATTPAAMRGQPHPSQDESNPGQPAAGLLCEALTSGAPPRIAPIICEKLRRHPALSNHLAVLADAGRYSSIAAPA